MTVPQTKLFLGKIDIIISLKMSNFYNYVTIWLLLNYQSIFYYYYIMVYLKNKCWQSSRWAKNS